MQHIKNYIIMENLEEQIKELCEKYGKDAVTEAVKAHPDGNGGCPKGQIKAADGTCIPDPGA